jgi:hypothetical protein
MANPVRYPQGVATAPKDTALWSMPAPHPTKPAFVFYDDFTAYANTVGGTADMPWVDTFVGAGSAIAALADEPFGAITLTCDAADNDAAQIQWHTENFTITAGKKTWFESRLKVSDATQSDWLVGLAVLDTTLLGSTDGDGVTDGIFFSKEDGDTQIDINIQKNTTTGQLRQANVATCTTSYMTLGFYYDGIRTVEFYFNGAKVYTLDLTATTSTYMPDTPLTVSFAIVNGEAVAKVMTIDYVVAAQER